jgi:hypothetical protein
MMRMIRLLRMLALLAVTATPVASFGASKADLDATMSHDGLKPIRVKGLDAAYARPGASLAGYNRVRLDPVEVAFRKDWDPRRSGSRVKLSAEEREGIRAGVAKIVQEEFARALQDRGAYPVVNEAGPDVLRVRAYIVNLYVNAPEGLSGGRTRTYTVSAGEMTLFLELFDSETGEVLARVVDRREARSTGALTLSSSVVNADEARAIAAAWARILRNGLDKAHGIGKK